MVSIARRRWPHQSLGPHRAALCSDRFQVGNARWPGRRLAHHLRRSRSLLRQGRILHRRVRNQRKCFQRSRRRLPASSQTALHRIDGQEGLRQAQHHLRSFAPRDHYAFAQWPPALPLLRPMRPRLHHRLEFQLQPGSAASGDENGEADAGYRRDGPRNSRQQRRQSRGRFLRR